MQKRILALLLCLAMSVVFLCPLAKADDLDDVKTDIDKHKELLNDYEKQLEAIQAKRDELQKQSEEQMQQYQGWLDEKKLIEQDATLLASKRDTIQSIIIEHTSVIRELEESLAETETELDRQIEDFSTVLVELYKNGNASQLEVFFRAESYSSYIAFVECMEQLLDSSDKRIEEINALIEQSEQTKKEHDDAIVSLSAKKRELIYSKIELARREAVVDYLIENNSGEDQYTQEEIDKKNQEEQDIANEIAQLLQQLNALKTEQQRLEEEKRKQELEEWLNNNQNQGGNDSYNTALRWPIPSAYGYYISSRFGWRDGQYAGQHNGLDIVPYAGEGTPILAAAAGTVIYSEYRGNFGNVVFIDHGNGLTTVYAHCHTLVAKKGDRVLAQQTIATVGTTGQSGGNHLHFAVVQNGSYVNPELFLPTFYTKP